MIVYHCIYILLCHICNFTNQGAGERVSQSLSRLQILKTMVNIDGHYNHHKFTWLNYQNCKFNTLAKHVDLKLIPVLQSIFNNCLLALVTLFSKALTIY